MKKISILQITATAVLAILFLCLSAAAVTLTPEARQKMSADGTLSEFVSRLKQAKAEGLNSPSVIIAKSNISASAEQVDTMTLLILLVDFSDKPFTADYFAADSADFDSILFSTARYNPTGSMTEYFLENSYGKLLIRGAVHGWYRMPQTYAYYVNGEAGGLGIYPTNSQGLADAAINVAEDAGLDFSKFDTYGSYGPDFKIDGLLIVHAGPGKELSGANADMLSHKWSLKSTRVVGGLIISDYTMQPEELYKKSISPIGVFCHEFGHVLGLPDLYDIDYEPTSSDGIGIWSLMATGNYKGNSRLPSHLDAYCKARMGFLDPSEVYVNIINAEFPVVEYNPIAYRLWKSGVYGTEYFLAENRQATGFDTLLPGSGLIIYHVDDATTDNNVEVTHYHVAVEQADGLYQIEYADGNEGDSGDPWPGSAVRTSFDDLSVPDSKAYIGSSSEVSVWNISNSDSMMTANLDIEWSRPNFELVSYTFSDANANGDLEPGETVEFYFTIKNHWLDANNATITLSSNDPSIEFIDASIQKSLVWGDGAFTNNVGQPLVFRLPDTLTPTFDSFFVSIVTDGGAFSKTFKIERQVGTPQVLLVDDDRGRSYDSLYASDLYKKLVPVDLWRKTTSGSPPVAVLNQYKMVFWFTGDTSSNLIQVADIAAMKQYLDNGGNLFLSGQQLAHELNLEDSAFMANYLHANAGPMFYSINLTGVVGSPIGNGLSCRYSSTNNQEYTAAQTIDVLSPAIPAFNFQGGGYAALSYSGSYRVVFFNFGYEALSTEFPRWNRRDTVLANILSFLGNIETEVADGGSNSILPVSFNLGQNYPNPFNPATIIRYTIHSLNGMRISNTVLKVYDILGREIKTLVDEKQIPGIYSISWDGTDQRGNQVASGIYFYRLTRGSDSGSKKMVLLK